MTEPEVNNESQKCMEEIKGVLAKYNAVFFFVRQETFDNKESRASWDWGVKIAPKEEPKE